LAGRGIGFDELSDFGAEIDGLDIDDITDGFGGQCGDVSGRGLGIDEEYVASLDGA
jgi:hypothetical protein